MQTLSNDHIRSTIADTQLIFYRGLNTYHHGSYFLSKKDLVKKRFTYEFDGTVGNYTARIHFKGDGVETSCDCPYPRKGCRHVVAGLLNAGEILAGYKPLEDLSMDSEGPNLSEEEIKKQALEDRKKRSVSETFTTIRGDMFKGDHLVINQRSRQYNVTLHDPEKGFGHCSCPDYLTNGLGTCKHIQFMTGFLKKEPGFKKQVAMEVFPYTDIYWDSLSKGPKLFSQRLDLEMKGLKPMLKKYFNDKGEFIAKDLALIMGLMAKLHGDKRVRIRENLLKRVDQRLHILHQKKLSGQPVPTPNLRAKLYPYQKEGVKFGVLKPGVLIGDEMGLGKTLQAISLGLLKKDIFGFSKILVITLASLKEQWKREIEKFSHEKATIIEGSPFQRKALYQGDSHLFKITNYEAVLRDITIISGFNPDMIILDEAQRIKNFSTKTSEAVKRLPKKHGIVLTGTPLENKLEDVYSIVQFLDPYLLTPLWKFAADHFMIPRKKKSNVAGYKNLEMLKDKLKPIVIRRKKEEVLKDLPREVVNNYYIDLTTEQQEIHSGYARSLLPLINKKFLTPMDMRRIQILLLRMRMVCDSTYLIDRDTHISPKLKELASIIDEMVIQNQRKMVIFSEWTTMTFLIARHLSDMNIPFIELSGKVPVKKRQALIDEFTNNPDCKVFLSTDAGGTGLNLQAADCVVNFELPWNPAKMNQRIGRVSRIGQESQCINVINLIAKQSIEERILAGIQLKTDLFKGVFEEGPDVVEFSREKRNEMLNRLREMMGEEPEPLTFEAAEPEDIPEDTPFFMNPEVLSRDEEEEKKEEPENEPLVKSRPHDEPAPENILANQPPEKIETVLNSGMEFIAGLMEMATGQKMEKSGDQEKMIKIDNRTGEVTMKFKLPGF
ncbi:MAG: DEAD/DEAH box helicase [Desulfobacula sp.]|uniref:SNF2-related protein n=2 Tax=Desulfobacula sp. TaxID=2593537 RepID=UPI001DD9D7DB|nr:DEAD/DEAH box helicase [Desulfobacula sp.]MBT3485407.1 DEAD/DEAH box helicase [Desulfobacula sp.]MBT4508820.1 DEAD/DEAH box helicase [Desulfobacula sp.]MBT5546695.1 DEAD/DEAH box helicase [Desulfobacula sp.]MBT7794803.1 DEAD/DEAH box helicase [Desulfobacula sp.]